MNILKRIQNYLGDVIAELKKVTWVRRRELVTTTLVVIAFSTVLALFVFLCDWAFRSLLGLIL